MTPAQQLVSVSQQGPLSLAILLDEKVLQQEVSDFANSAQGAAF